jgi:hypothetical protein
MRVLTLLLLMPAGLSYAQATGTTTPPATPAAEKTVAQTASPDLVGQLVSELAITPAQAEGAAATIFNQAKGKLSVDDFAKVAAAVPNMEGLLKAAPAAAKGADLLAGAGGALGAAAATASALGKLGIKPETIVKVAPAVIKFVQTKGGAQVASLLAGALK